MIYCKDAILYRLLYSEKNTIKGTIASRINNSNNANKPKIQNEDNEKESNDEKYYSRQGFDSKESNIPVETYRLILSKLKSYSTLLHTKRDSEIKYM